ncbi:MAG: hypothetical protein AAFX39_13275 [Pseudomonadota bacterium]
MVRRISSSQAQSKLRQAQSKLRQAQTKRRQAISKLNQEIRAYNSKVRAHNARARANRERLRRELQKLARSTSQPRYVTYRASVQTVQQSYLRLEQHAEANVHDGSLDRFLDLSEREAANSVSVINALHGESPENESDVAPPASSIEHILDAISPDVRNRWHGALYALNPQNPDAARHFCTSARELLTEILERFARDDEVKAAQPNCDLTQQGKPTRRAKIRFFFQRHGVIDEAVTEFVEDDMENVVQLFQIFNKGTHGDSGRFEHSQLLAIRARVEGAVSFLWSIITGEAFA